MEPDWDPSHMVGNTDDIFSISLYAISFSLLGSLTPSLMLALGSLTNLLCTASVSVSSPLFILSVPATRRTSIVICWC